MLKIIIENVTNGIAKTVQYIYSISVQKKIFEGHDHRRVEIFAKVVYTYLTVNDSL